jgi:hypothetical protein
MSRLTRGPCAATSPNGPSVRTAALLQHDDHAHPPTACPLCVCLLVVGPLVAVESPWPGPSHVVWSRAAWRSRSSQPRIPRQSVSKPSLHGLIPHPHVRSPSDSCRLLYYDDDDRTLISGKPMDVSVDYDRVDQRVSGSPPSRWCVRRILVLHGHGPVAPLRARVAVLASHPLPGVRPGYAMQYLDGDMPLSAASMTGLSAGAYENKSPRIKKGLSCEAQQIE